MYGQADDWGKACTGASAGPEPGVWLMVELGA